MRTVYARYTQTLLLDTFRNTPWFVGCVRSVIWLWQTAVKADATAGSPEAGQGFPPPGTNPNPWHRRVQRSPTNTCTRHENSATIATSRLSTRSSRCRAVQCTTRVWEAHSRPAHPMWAPPPHFSHRGVPGGGDRKKAYLHASHYQHAFHQQCEGCGIRSNICSTQPQGRGKRTPDMQTAHAHIL